RLMVKRIPVFSIFLSSRASGTSPLRRLRRNFLCALAIHSKQRNFSTIFIFLAGLVGLLLSGWKSLHPQCPAPKHLLRNPTFISSSTSKKSPLSRVLNIQAPVWFQRIKLKNCSKRRNLCPALT